MTFHALVVDDDPEIREDVQDRLESLGHTCDMAGSQEAANTLLPKNRYAYVLLDLEIPVKYGRPSRVTNGKNLLRFIRQIKGFEDIPIIVMTSHGHDSPLLAVDVMSNAGAVNFVMKPFPDNGPTLEKAIREALRQTGRSCPGAKSHSELAHDPDPPQPFEEGEMVFSETRVELCGVRICDGVGSGLMRAILDALRERDSRGRFVALSGDELAQRADNATTCQNDIADAVRRLRKKIQTVLLEQANIRCTRGDVITNDRRYGYRFSSKIEVRDADDVRNDLRNGEDDVRNDPRNDVNDVRNGPNDPRNAQDDVKNLSARQEWILDELAGKGEVRKDEMLQGYKKQFGLSKTTLERDLKALRSHSLIRFDGDKRTGHWRRM